MIQKTLMVFGPGGIGKTHLDGIIRSDVLPIDPYRLRKRPRDQSENGESPDLFYAHRNLREELLGAFKALREAKERLCDKPAVEWFPTARTTFFDVRGEWQCLLLGSLNAQLAKAEIFGPVVPALFGRQDVRELFGELSIIVLNPVAPLRNLNGDYSSLKKATADNCEKAGRSDSDIKKRVNSIDDPEAPEAAAWLAMLEMGGVEFPHWPFPEYVYKTNRISTLLEARRRLIDGFPALKQFFKTDDEIRPQWWYWDIGKLSDHSRGDGDDFIPLEDGWVFGTATEVQQDLQIRLKHREATYADSRTGSDNKFPYYCPDQGNFALSEAMRPTGDFDPENPKYKHPS